MDNLDKKILRELLQNSRVPITKLSKKLKTKREVINYRIKKLKENKIILDFTTEIDYSKLGYIGIAVFIQIKLEKEKEFKEYLKKLNYISWFSQLTGIWSFGFSILGKNKEQLQKRFLEISKNFEEEIIDYRILMHDKNRFFQEKIFGGNAKDEEKLEETIQLDKKDKLILKELLKNSRVTPVDISKKLNLTAQAISNRLKILNKKLGIKYSLLVNFEKLGIYQHSIFIKNKNILQRSKLIEFLKNHKKVSFIAEYLENEILEFGIFVENPYKIRKYVKEVEEQFPKNRLIEISLFQQDINSTKPAECILED
jgi:DNA-binding Lrp family transcriptional regulator